MLKLPAIELQTISKTYRIGRTTQTVLNQVTLSVAHGEFISVIGPSGSGKTTLAHIMGGLIKPSQGKVLADGQNLQEASDAQLSRFRNRQVGFVFQNFSLLPRYSALENTAMPLMLAKISPRERLQRARASLQAVGLEHRLNAQAHQLSGGERQRVAIARALIQNPRIIIADEPTGSLDTAQGNDIATLLQNLQRKHGATLIMVTHNPELAARASRTLQLRDGNVVAGAH